MNHFLSSLLLSTLVTFTLAGHCEYKHIDDANTFVYVCLFSSEDGNFSDITGDHIDGFSDAEVNVVIEDRAQTNQMNVLSDVITSKFINLRNLSLTEFGIQRISNNLNSLFLEELDLSRNSLTSFNLTFKYLKVLNLSSNFIRSISRSTFARLHMLEYVDISNNQLRSIQSNTFGENRNLQFLNLSHNNLTTFNISVFGQQTELKKLDLSHNRIFEFSLSRNTLLRQLNELNLGNNDFSDFSASTIRTFTNLEYLTMSHNRIRVLSASHHKLPNLRIINFDWNEIYAIDVDFFISFPGMDSFSAIGNECVDGSSSFDLSQCFHNYLMMNNPPNHGNGILIWIIIKLILYTLVICMLLGLLIYTILAVILSKKKKQPVIIATETKNVNLIANEREINVQYQQPQAPPSYQDVFPNNQNNQSS